MYCEALTVTVPSLTAQTAQIDLRLINIRQNLRDNPVFTWSNLTLFLEGCVCVGGNLGIILVQVYEPAFWNLPQSYIWIKVASQNSNKNHCPYKKMIFQTYFNTADNQLNA